jgi:hypothetical protein
VTDLFAPVVSITTTKRRRFFWAVWSSGPPTRAPFRRPDTSGGGASTRDEALAAAKRASGHETLLEIEPEWARACIRLLRGQSPWQGAASYPGASARRAERSGDDNAASIWSVLGVAPNASLADLKLAFRRRAIETHPDQGGDPEAFRRLVAAFREAQRRARKPRRKTT